MPRGGILAALARVEGEEPETGNQAAEVLENESVEADALEPEVEPTSVEPGPPSLEDRLRQFGIEDAPPESLSNPEVAGLIEKVLAGSDSRVRGFQSTITKAAQDIANERQALGAKAAAYDALQQDQMYQRFIKAYQEGKIPEDTDELDLEKLPTEPMERFKTLSQYSVKEPLTKIDTRVSKLEQKLQEQEAMAAWMQFKNEHPDAEDMLQEIGEAMAQGFPMEVAYKAAKAVRFDPEAERQKIIAEYQASIKGKTKLAGVATKTSKAADKTEIPPEEFDKLDRRQKLFYFLGKAEEEHLAK